jgi:hypothetical protein
MIGRTLCTGSESVPGRLSTASTPVRGWLHVSLTPASRCRSRVRELVPVRLMYQVESCIELTLYGVDPRPPIMIMMTITMTRIIRRSVTRRRL